MIYHLWYSTTNRALCGAAGPRTGEGDHLEPCDKCAAKAANGKLLTVGWTSDSDDQRWWSNPALPYIGIVEANPSSWSPRWKIDMTPVGKETCHWSFPTLDAAIQWVASRGA